MHEAQLQEILAEGERLLEARQFADAAERYRAAVRIDATSAAARLGLGVALDHMGRHGAAAAALRRAVELDPALADAHYCLGCAYRASGDIPRALDAFREAVRLEPGDDRAWNGRAEALVVLDPSKPTDAFRADLIACLDYANLDHRSLVVAAARAVLNEPDFAALASRLSATETREQVLSPEANLDWQTVADPLLVRSLVAAVIPDLTIEAVLTRARASCLEAWGGIGTVPATTDFLCALAQQCHLNEYIYDLTDEEIEVLPTLEKAIGQRLDGELPSIEIALLACYRPLHCLSLAPRILARGAEDETLSDLLERQIAEATQEAEIAARLPQLTAVAEDVSMKVRAQYEENPYPRWRGLPRRSPRSLSAVLASIFPGLNTNDIPEAPSVLVAGCGTGLEAFYAASRFAGASVVAIDLSKASLAFAERKRDELDIANIEFAQADLLEIGTLNRQFDLIQCTGVLHHMADPAAGLRILASCLRPHGFMRIGLYSGLARRHIGEARRVVAANGYPPTIEGIRECRREIIAHRDKPAWAELVGIGDFFTTSECRDLLFHVQERSFDLNEVAALLAANDLEFIGFEFSDIAVRHRFAEWSGGDASTATLDQWKAFEQANPDAFRTMYQFWTRRADRDRA